MWILFFILILSTNTYNFFHNEAGATISGKLSYGGFSQILQVYMGTPPQPYQCIVHGGDSYIVVNFDPTLDGWFSSTFIDEVLQVPMIYFTIGSFKGSLPVIYNPSYVYSFNNSAVSCVFGLGRANPLYWRSPEIHLTPTSLRFNEKSNSDMIIKCNRFDTALCTFDAVYKLNDTIIGYAPTQLSNTVPYSVLPVDIFNTVLLLDYAENYWNTITICNGGCIDIPSESYILQLHNYIQKTIFSTTVNQSTIGVTVLRNLDVSVDSKNSQIAIKERSFTLINSYGVYLIWIFFVGVYGFLILAPSVRFVRIPKYVEMYRGVRGMLEIAVLIIPFLIFTIPDYYDNFVLEFEWFHYMFMSYIGVVSILGFISLVLNEIMSFFTISHYYLPIISCLNIILLLSLFDFQEGNPTIIQAFYSFIIGNYLFTVAYSFLFITSFRQIAYLAFGIFFLAMAFGWSIFASTYFIIPSIQNIIVIKLNYLYFFWPVISMLCAILGMYHYGALLSKIQIWEVQYRKKHGHIKNT